MSMFINVECLAANALIGLYEVGQNRIGFNQLADYGLLVVEQYKKESAADAVFIFDPDAILGLTINYSDFFQIDNDGKQKYLSLKDGADIKEMKENFRWTLSYVMLKVINRVNVIDVMNAANT